MNNTKEPATSDRPDGSPTVLGGWTPYGPLDAEDRAIFEAATRDLEGVEYTPLEVSRQVVAGMKYKFLCNAQVVSPGAPSYEAVVEMFVPPGGKPTITSITDLGSSGEGNPTVGGWTPFHALTSKDKEVFDLATHGLVGVEYTPLKVSTQIVAGTNYRFLCNAQVVYPGSHAYRALVFIYAPLEGPPRITDIRPL